MLMPHLLPIAFLVLAAPAAEPAPDQLVAQLGAARWQEREAASEKLLALGKDALPALEAALQSADSEIRHRARLLVDRVRWQTAAPLPESLALAFEQFPRLTDEERADLLTRVANELRGQAAPILRRVVRTDPSAMVRRIALDRLTTLDPQAAEDELRQLADRPAAPPWAAPALADLLASLGKNDKAIAAYEAARKLNPQNLQLAASLARLYEGRKDWAKARDLYAGLADAQPNLVHYHMNLGRCLYRLGETAKAEAVWRSVIQGVAATPQAYLWLANAYQSVGAPEKALAILREGVEKNPRDAALARYFASVLDREGKTHEAIAAYERAYRTAELEGVRRTIAYNLAYLLRRGGQLDAYLDAQQADPAEARPPALPLLRHLAETYHSLRDFSSAARVLRRLRTLRPQSDEAKWATDLLQRLGGKE